jgi:hypothetical protein
MYRATFVKSASKYRENLKKISLIELVEFQFLPKRFCVGKQTVDTQTKQNPQNAK